MTCNSCMSKQLKEHVCREKGLESNCPICHDFLFTSNTPVKALPCGHFMHSACFQVSLHFSTMIILVSCQKGLTLCEWHSYNGMTTVVVLPSNCCFEEFSLQTCRYVFLSGSILSAQHASSRLCVTKALFSLFTFLVDCVDACWYFSGRPVFVRLRLEDLRCLAAGVPQCLIICLTHIILQAYTCSHYTCPICSKSLGDMAVSSAQPHDFVFLPPIWKLFLCHHL
jgi:hypothetical protein